MREALAAKERGTETVILAAVCGHGHFDLAAYDTFNAGEMVDFDYPEAKVADALTRLPQIDL